MATEEVEWQVVPDFPNYEVTREGILRNAKTKRVRTPNYNGTSYHTLLKDGKNTSRTPQGLVANAYPDEVDK